MKPVFVSVKKCLLLIGCCGTIQLFAQPDLLKLWKDSVPGETETKHPPVNYTANTSGNNIHRITNITDPTLQVFRPTQKSNGAAVIICPGGGNKYLAVNLEGEEIATWLASQGYMAFVLEYRVPLKTMGAFQDVQRAVRLIRSKAYEWKLKTDMIGVMGFSAGGNLAARAATGFKNKSYKPQDLADSLSCRPDFALLVYPGSLATADKKLLPDLVPTQETPPIFMFVASDDPFNAPFPLGQALRDQKLPFEFHIVAKGGHGYGMRKGNPAAEAWPPLAATWLRQTVFGKM
jgi:acetyl esterase/lipase